MVSAGTEKLTVVVPKCHYRFGSLIVFGSFVVLLILNSRASSLDTVASALGLYSAALLGVFSILTVWKSNIIQRRSRYIQVEEMWSDVIDRSVLFALRGSAISFMIMLFSVIAPAVKHQLFDVLHAEAYSWSARVFSALAISGVVMLGLMSLQIVRDVTAIYEWNSQVEAQDAAEEAEREAKRND